LALFTCLVVIALALAACRRDPTPTADADADDAFLRWSSQGRALVEAGDAPQAAEAFRRAVALQPTHPDSRQNLAIALLWANDPAAAAIEARELIRLNQNLGAAHFLLGAAHLRLGQASNAVQELQVSKDIDHTVNATSYLLGRAYQDLGRFEEAAQLYDEVLQFEPNHPSAAYNLSQALTRLGRTDEAATALQNHQQNLAQRGNSPLDSATVEASEHTTLRVPFRLERPDPDGIPVRFTDATPEFLGPDASRYQGPFAVLDINHDQALDLWVRDGDAQFRLLRSSGQGSQLTPSPQAIPVTPEATWHKVLVGDLNRDRYEDVILLGDQGLHAFRLATNGAVTDATAFANLRQQPAVDGLLADLDFTGNLDLILVTPEDRSLRVLRNLGNLYFTNGTATAGLPADATGISRVLTDDWNGDELNDLFLGRPGQPPLLLTKARGGPLTNAPLPDPWPVAHTFVVGDLNNDLRQDLVLAQPDRLTVVFNGFTQRLDLPLGTSAPASLLFLLDYDNDGWLDLFAATPEGLRAWRNLGQENFRETTADLHLNAPPLSGITQLAAADLDHDGDSDLIVAAANGLRVIRNDGGNAQHQLKLRLLGTRSNPSGIGLRIELTAGNWRALRTVHQLPIEIGVGLRTQIDTLNVRWFDTLSTDIDTPVQPRQQIALIELIRPTGSCPYLYRWDGQRFTFVTDLLGAAPLGLPVAPGRLIEANPEEIVRIGNTSQFPPRNGYHTLQITEELREILYLDTAQLLVVDHPHDTEIHPTDKLVPGRPFPPSDLLGVQHPLPLRQAVGSDDRDLTEALRSVDLVHASPPSLRPPQQRGYADPHSITLDFGPLPVDRPLVLVLDGWLRFGGGMANMSASRDPDIPFPFPTLEVEINQSWHPVEVTVGAPCGKTKSIVVPLDGHLPAGSGRLRLSQAFEIHWDRIALFEAVPAETLQVHRQLPDRSDLHWRGYSEFLDLPWTQPLTPDYDQVRSWPDWRITPSGWCTRYGPVDELLAQRDGGLVLLNGGDELTLEFAADRFPPLPPGMQRTFFLSTVGWDKDADFHVVLGDRVEPLPWEGMDDQRYGQEVRPPHPGDALNQRFNTRWVGPVAQIRRPPPMIPTANRQR
jgi:tetratricopeptide (TPR) repeat protein